MQDGIFSASLTKVDKQLVYINTGDEVKYQEFVKLLEAGDNVDMFMEINTGDGTLAQLAKVHKCIRVLANHNGENYEDMKLYVKDQAGLVIIRSIKGREYSDWKSFGKCSRDDLNLAIQACIEIGDISGLNLR